MRRKWGWAAATGGGVATLAGLAAYGAVGPSSQLFGPYRSKGDPRNEAIALTFDDGPSESTPILLDYLESQHVPATFFQCGMNVAHLPNIARQVAERGHQIGNHTYSHPLLAMKMPAFIDHEFGQAQTIIEQETGVTPTILRPPFGVRWLGMRRPQKRLGLLGIGWTVIGYDWKWPAERIAEYVLSAAAAGGIIVLHDGRKTKTRPDISATIGATKAIVPVLKQRGYRFRTIQGILDQG
jgi:peptidoglycan/xylan/chitin deacetylase (PgdA/CDA1 family)